MKIYSIYFDDWNTSNFKYLKQSGFEIGGLKKLFYYKYHSKYSTCYKNLGNPCYNTFHNLNPDRIQAIIEFISKNMGKFIVYADPRLYLKINLNMDLKEENLNTNIDMFTFNTPEVLDFLVINCNEYTLDFFKNIFLKISQDKMWDVEAVSNCLSELRVQNLNNSIMYSSLDEHSNNEYLYQPKISTLTTSPKDSNFV